MRYRVWSIIAILALIAVPAFPASFNQYTTTKDVTTVETLTFAYGGTNFNAYRVQVCNLVETVDTLYARFDGGVATVAPGTDHISVAIRPGRCYTYRRSKSIPTVSLICATAQTCSSVDVDARD